MPPLLFRLKASLIILLVTCSCNRRETGNDSSLARREHYAEVLGVRTAPASKGNFAMELISNDRLRAVSKAAITFGCMRREAMTLRQGRQVVLTLEDSIAMWNYVETGYENSLEFSIDEGLKGNQEVIISGNFNLSMISVINWVRSKINLK